MIYALLTIIIAGWWIAWHKQRQLSKKYYRWYTVKLIQLADSGREKDALASESETLESELIRYQKQHQKVESVKSKVREMMQYAQWRCHKCGRIIAKQDLRWDSNKPCCLAHRPAVVTKSPAITRADE